MRRLNGMQQSRFPSSKSIPFPLDNRYDVDVPYFQRLSITFYYEKEIPVLYLICMFVAFALI